MSDFALHVSTFTDFVGGYWVYGVGIEYFINVDDKKPFRRSAKYSR